ncbi:hypothetical protein [Mycolicibacterium sp. CBMA 226]|uniref:hypothetical protein n=1 Tax=Mycolicibacterium sp. CBMA 226 TaxID=2606611 RepID=UPI0012DD4D5B|nr:hypothetical protein [Mycolicibacterium sp. CBMA 226]MUL78823.1 hypothetical protein [Mycolicibacterium sp. CBMA 226]QGW61119.1 hypothetical protein ICEMyc226_00087 [Mycolicibacterium sp.]
MPENTTTGRARHLGPAAGLVHAKDDKRIIDWTGDAQLYLLSAALRGYTAVVVATNDNSDHAPEFGIETNVYGLEGEGLLLDWDDVAGGRGIHTATAALAGAGYTIH